MKEKGPQLMGRLLLILDKDAGSPESRSLLNLFTKLNYYLILNYNSYDHSILLGVEH
jgi:hypothetical protein